jgi:hypothetical protein
VSTAITTSGEATISGVSDFPGTHALALAYSAIWSGSLLLLSAVLADAEFAWSSEWGVGRPHSTKNLSKGL